MLGGVHNLRGKELRLGLDSDPLNTHNIYCNATTPFEYIMIVLSIMLHSSCLASGGERDYCKLAVIYPRPGSPH